MSATMGTVCQLLPPSAYLALYHAATCVGKTTHKYFATMATYTLGLYKTIQGHSAIVHVLSPLSACPCVKLSIFIVNLN